MKLFPFTKKKNFEVKSVSFKKAVEISSTQEICTEFTHIIYCIWVNSVQISWVLDIYTAFLKETDFRKKPDLLMKLNV